jgi:hypothetical protein
VLLADSASYVVHAPGVGIGHSVALGLAVGVGVGLWPKIASLKLSSKNRTSGLRKNCALPEGLICFFTVVPSWLVGISGNNPLRLRMRVYGGAKPISIRTFGFCVFTITALLGCTSTSL